MNIAINEICILNQKLYKKAMEPVEQKFDLSRAELDILMFLANDPEHDTASDVVEYRGLVKSHVSAAVAGLEEKGYIQRFYYNGNKRTIHLELTEAAKPVIEAGRKAQAEFEKTILQGITGEEADALQKILKKMMDSVKEA